MLPFTLSTIAEAGLGPDFPALNPRGNGYRYSLVFIAAEAFGNIGFPRSGVRIINNPGNPAFAMNYGCKIVKNMELSLMLSLSPQMPGKSQPRRKAPITR